MREWPKDPWGHLDIRPPQHPQTYAGWAALEAGRKARALAATRSTVTEQEAHDFCGQVFAGEWPDYDNLTDDDERVEA